jgi:hypothetical protein
LCISKPMLYAQHQHNLNFKVMALLKLWNVTSDAGGDDCQRQASR